MYYRVTKLKRYKLLNLILNIVSFPIRFPIFLLYVIAENATKIAENLLDIYDKFLYWIMEIVVNFFKFSEIADEQYEKNKEKFKKDCWFAFQILRSVSRKKHRQNTPCTMTYVYIFKITKER